METKDLGQQGAKIAEARKNRNMTQEQLANLLHVGKQAVSNWENGKNDLDPETSQNLEHILGIQLRQRQPRTKAAPFMEGIKDLREIRTAKELKTQLDLILDCVPFDSAYSTSVRRVLKLLFLASFAHQTGIEMCEAIATRRDFREAYTITWGDAAFYLEDITYEFNPYVERAFWKNYQGNPATIKTEDILEVAVKYIAEETTDGKPARIADTVSVRDDLDSKYIAELIECGNNAAKDLIGYGLLPNYHSPIGFSLRIALYEFFETCAKVYHILEEREANEYDVPEP